MRLKEQKDGWSKLAEDQTEKHKLNQAAEQFTETETAEHKRTWNRLWPKDGPNPNP